MKASDICPWNSKLLLVRNLLLKNSAPKRIKYFLNTLLKITNIIQRLDDSLQGNYKTVHVLYYC